jgi:TolA-binding protein
MMKGLSGALIFLALVASPVAAADKTHQQMMAEIRMLQEQQQQLHQLLFGLADTLKTLTAKIDDQTGVTRKGFADQKLMVDGVAEGVRILREKADDTNVRLSTMVQELETMRQTIASMPAPSPATPVDPNVPVDPSMPVTPAAPQTGPPAGVSPAGAWRSAFNDYSGGQYDLAIQGFEFYLKSFPNSPQADDAQLNICNSYYAMGRYEEAAAACQKVISDHPKGDVVSTAYYKLGLSYEGLKRPELARRAYETLIKEFPTERGDATLAKQRLDALNKKE